MEKQYGQRDPIALEKAGGYFTRHMQAMTAEDLFDKSAIAEELAWRDMEIDRLPEQLAGAVTTVRLIADMSAWHRGEEGRTHLAFQVADNADLSTPAHRRDALRAAVQAAVNGANA